MKVVTEFTLRLSPDEGRANSSFRSADIAGRRPGSVLDGLRVLEVLRSLNLVEPHSVRARNCGLRLRRSNRGTTTRLQHGHHL